MHRRLSFERLVPVFVLGPATLAIVLVALIAPWTLQAQSTLPCSPRDQHADVADVQLTPGIRAHQSWVRFQNVDPRATFFELCLDGIQVAVMPHTFHDGTVEFSLRTTFVDVLWATRRIEEYRRASHWEVYWWVCTFSANEGYSSCV